MDQPEKELAEKLNVELNPYDPEQAEAILDRLAELLFSVWLKRREAGQAGEGEDPERPRDDGGGGLERVAG